MRVVALMASLVVSAALAGAGKTVAAQEGCTPCECGIAFCSGGAQYWPRFGDVNVTRENDTATLTWQLRLDHAFGRRDPNASFTSQLEILWANESKAAEWAYPYRWSRDGTYPGTGNATIIWPESKPLYVRLYANAAHSNETHSPAVNLQATGGAPSPPISLALLVVVLAAIPLTRRPR